MKNVVIHKIVKFVFTEEQMRSAWKHLKKNRDYDSLSDQETMKLAKKMLETESHSDLEHHTLGSPWRTKEDFEGRMLNEDDSDPDMHVELIDTSEKGRQASVFIDRMLRIKCKECGFDFFIEDLDYDLTGLKCPKDGGAVEAVNRTTNQIKKR
jgi:predicted Zn-ribbon and HTH transcriptional regulator